MEPDSTLTPAERDGLVEQLTRLNDNIEHQFGLIEDQRVQARRSDRRRWEAALLVAAAFALTFSFVTVRQNRIHNDQRRDQCHASNAARSEIRSAFDLQGQALMKLAAGSRLAPPIHQLIGSTHDSLASALPVAPC